MFCHIPFRYLGLHYPGFYTLCLMTGIEQVFPFQCLLVAQLELAQEHQHLRVQVVEVRLLLLPYWARFRLIPLVGLR